MTTRVKLLAYFRKYLPPGAEGKWAEMDLPDGATASTLIERLGVPRELVSLILVNGERSDAGTPLKDGDEVRLLPPIPGG